MKNDWPSAKIKFMPDMIDRLTANSDAINWCTKNFGPAGEEWYWTYNHTFHFRNPRDATIFSLRWG